MTPTRNKNLAVILLIEFTLLIFCVNAFSQSKSFAFSHTRVVRPAEEAEGEITYSCSGSNLLPRNTLATVFYSQGHEHLVTGNLAKNEQFYTDFRQLALIRVLALPGRHLIQVSSFEEQATPQEGEDTVVISGKVCHKFIYEDLADTLTGWVWMNTTLRGSPDQRLTSNDGLVLAIDRNSKRLWQVKQIVLKKVSKAEMKWPALKGPYVSTEEYQNAIIESQRILIPLISHTLIAQQSATNPSFDHFTFTERYARGNLLLKRLKVPLFKESDRVFLKLSSYSNGDPSPRAGSVFLITQGKKTNFLSILQKKSSVLRNHKYIERYPGISLSNSYTPQVELMRFTTPYGIRYYNKQVTRKGYHWADSAVYRQDITDLKDLMGKEVWLGVFVSGGDSRGNMVNLNMEVYPEDPFFKTKKQRHYIEPLVFTVNPLASIGQHNDEVFQSDSVSLQFTVPKGLTNLRLRYIGTSGQGEAAEHTFQENQLEVDNEIVAHFVPFRSDCGSFRNLNPTSPVDRFGSFDSDLTRGGWCPGAITLPVYFPLGELDEGAHSFMVTVPRSPENVPTREKWQISICLLGDYLK